VNPSDTGRREALAEGAAPTTAVADIAISEHLDGQSVPWLEKVTDAQ
jgi:hypothetical protein